jgi:ATP-dependent Clp protease ATP-binding subunit ClpA
MMIYSLLGHFSTYEGSNFLSNLDDPDLIRRARKLGDFTGLKKRITQKEIRELLSTITGIPVQSISNVESQKLLNLESTLHKRVIGQEEAIIDCKSNSKITIRNSKSKSTNCKFLILWSNRSW